MYSKENCPWCVKARDFLFSQGVSNYSELKVGEHLSAQEFKKIAQSNNWTPPTVPLMFFRNSAEDSWTLVGGYENLVKYFGEKNGKK